MKTGFFTVDELHMICDCPCIEQAKKMAINFIRHFEKTHSKMNKKNVVKAMFMVENCVTVQQLGISAANFMLAHPSENLSMQRGSAEDCKKIKKKKKK